MKITAIILCNILVFAVFGQTPLNQATVTLSPSKDAFVWFKQNNTVFTNTNFGSSVELSVIAGTHGGSPTFFKTYMGFDLSSLPKNAIITQADLYLYSRGDHSQISGSNESRLNAVTNGWDESTITYDNSPTINLSGGNGPLIPASNTGGVHDPNKDYIIDITSFINNYRTEDALSFYIELVTNVKYRKLTFWSKEYGTTSERPKLVLTLAAYVQMSPDITGDFIQLRGEELFVQYYEEEFPSGNLNYRILDPYQEELPGLSIISNITKGHNFIGIDVSGLSLMNNEFYILEITDTSKNKKYLRFKKII